MSEIKRKIEDAQIDLIKDLGIDKLPKEEREKILSQIGEVIQQKVTLRIVEELPEEKQEDFAKILEEAGNNPEKLDNFLEENIPNVQDIVLEEIGEYKKGALDFLGKHTGGDNAVSEKEEGGVDAEADLNDEEQNSKEDEIEERVDENRGEDRQQEKEKPQENRKPEEGENSESDDESLIKKNQVKESGEELDISGELEK
jgi:hypothetical protein